MTELEPDHAVRLHLADLDDDRQIFTDTQIDHYLALNAGNVRLAAADALDAIGLSEALVSKVIRTQDLQTDGVKLAAELRARADRLRKLAADETAAGEVDVFDIVPTGQRRPCAPELTPHSHDVVWGL